MKIENCGDPSPKTTVVPEAYNCCTFIKIDSWDENAHPKTCDTMYYLSDGSGAYLWDGEAWNFISFSGGSGGIPDAPSDGKMYVRQDGAWVELPTSPSGNQVTLTANGETNNLADIEVEDN